MTYGNPHCLDCGIDTMAAAEYYSVHDHIWSATTGLDPNAGMLCIGCLELRLGRPLTAADFTAAPINNPLLCEQSPRLADRMRAR